MTTHMFVLCVGSNVDVKVREHPATRRTTMWNSLSDISYASITTVPVPMHQTLGPSHGLAIFLVTAAAKRAREHHVMGIRVSRSDSMLYTFTGGFPKRVVLAIREISHVSDGRQAIKVSCWSRKHDVHLLADDYFYHSL